jgi:hypothetical protein
MAYNVTFTAPTNQAIFDKLSPEAKTLVDTWVTQAHDLGKITTYNAESPNFLSYGQALDLQSTPTAKLAYIQSVAPAATGWGTAFPDAGVAAMKKIAPKVSGFNDATLKDIISNPKSSSITPYKTAMAESFKPNAPNDVYTPTKYSQNVQDLTSRYGGLLNSKGKPVFSKAYIDSVASGAVTAEDFKAKLDPYIDKVMGYTVDTATNSLDPSDPKYKAARQAVINNPTKFVNDYNTYESKLTQNAQGTWDTATPSTTGTGLTNFIDANGKFIYNGGKNQLGGAETDPASMSAMVEAYDPNAGTWQAPTRKYLGTKDGKPVYSDNQSVSSATPFGDLLNQALANHRDPYAAGYVNPLTMPEEPDLTGVKKTANVSPTASDLLKLANTAGQTYDPKVVTSVSPALSQMYQPSTITRADGSTYTAKPGAPDTTKTTIPTLTSDGTGIINSNGTVTKIDNTDITPKEWWYTRGFNSEAQANANGWFNDIKKVSDDINVTQQPVVTYTYAPSIEQQLEDKAVNAGYQGDYTDTAAKESFIAGGLPSLISPITYAPSIEQQLEDKAVNAGYQGDYTDTAAMESFINANNQSVAPAQTVALPPSGPQPINPSNGGPQPINPSNGGPSSLAPITAAQIDLGPLNIPNLGAVIGPQAMNSNAGGVASLVGPQVTVQPQPQPAVTYTYAPSSQQQLEDKAVNAGYQGDYTDTAAMNSYINANNQSVTQQPAVTQQPIGVSGNTSPLFIPPDTRVFDTAGDVVAGKRKLIV